jgi:hypothetical protein
MTRIRAAVLAAALLGVAVIAVNVLPSARRTSLNPLSASP